jgi:hypothetical protein
MLSRDHEPSAPEPAPGAGRETSLRWAVLDQVLRLRHRQRAALTLRYVLGLPPAAVARVLGVSKPRAREIAEAGNARVIRAFGRRVDVSRHLRSVGSLLGAAVEEAPAPAAAQPRSVFKLLLSTIGEAPAVRGRMSTAAVSLRPRPIYNVRHDPPAGSPPALPPTPHRAGKQRRIGLAIAACVAALMFLGAFVPAALVAPTARLPLAALPVAPVVQEVSEAPPVPSAAFAVVVRAGDTLWSIAGRELGKESRWNEIWRTNAGRLMADGTRFLDPDLIQPGWRLKLPAR